MVNTAKTMELKEKLANQDNGKGMKGSASSDSDNTKNKSEDAYPAVQNTSGKVKDKNKDNMPAKGENSLWNYINTRKEAISKTLPKHMTPERMGMIAFNEIRKNPGLLKCSPQSLFGAILSASQLGVEPGPLGQCYLVPFYNGKTKSYDVQFLLGYKGMIELARRSGAVTNIYAHEVRQKDEFHYSYGLNPDLKHVPALKDRGQVIGFYAVAHLKEGGHYFEYMPVEEVEKRKERSKSKEYGPWISDYEEMGKKTVLRHMWKYLPVSVEIMKKAVLDETVTDIERPYDPTSVYELDPDNNQDKYKSSEDVA